MSVTNQRLFASFSVPLSEIRQISKGNDVSLNDVVLAICSGALRHYLADRGCVPSDPLLAAVPVSLREAGNTELNNQVSMMRVSLASTISDPLERLQAIRQSSATAKATSTSMKSVTPTDFPSLGAPWLISGMASLFGRSKLANSLPPLANVAISNVPGPKFALYMAGARMLTYYPVSIAVHSMALNVTVQSYNGSLDFGLTACRKALPDLPELAQLMLAAHHELLKLTLAPAPEKAHTSPPVVAAVAVPSAPAKSAAPRKPATKRPARKKAAAPLKLVSTATRAPRGKRAAAA